MIRLLQILLLVAVVIIVWRLARKLLSARPPGGEPPRFEPARRCAKCGTHVPREQLDAAGLCQRCTS